MGKASIYRGFQSTQTQGGLKENLILNRLKIVTLVMGFDTDQHFLKQRTLLGWGSGLGGLAGGLGDLTTTAPRGKSTGYLGCAWGGDSSGLLGWIQGRAGIRPKAKRKGKSFSIFISPFKKYKPM
jgi:hypothetical protein